MSQTSGDLWSPMVTLVHLRYIFGTSERALSLTSSVLRHPSVCAGRHEYRHCLIAEQRLYILEQRQSAQTVRRCGWLHVSEHVYHRLQPERLVYTIRAPPTICEAASSGPAVHIARTRRTHREPAGQTLAVSLGLRCHAPAAGTQLEAIARVISPVERVRSSVQVSQPGRPKLRALAPRPHTPLLSRADALRVLDADLALVGAWCLHAIAKAWDSRRLGYANDGKNPFELEVAAILGISTGHASDHIAAARQRVAELLPDYRSRHASTPKTPLALLADEFRLSPTAVDALLIIAAPALWGELARLFGILGNDPGRPLCDELMVSQILDATGNARHDLARELDADCPLRRYGLVREATGLARPFAALTVDPVVLLRLRRQPIRCVAGDAMTVVLATRTLDEMVLPRDAFRDLMTQLARPATTPARLVVRGRPGSGRRTLLAALAHAARRKLAIIDVSSFPREPSAFVDALRRQLSRALLAGFLPCLTETGLVALSEHGLEGAVRDVLRAHPGPLAVRLPSEARPPLDPGYLELDIPIPSEGERRAIWQRAGAGAGADELAARYRVMPGTIFRAAAQVDPRRCGADATAALGAAVRQSLDDRLGRLATRVGHLADWDSVVLPDDVLDSVREIVARVRHRRVVFETWGFDQTIGSGRGLTALFQGGPGTGKTMVAGALARELGVDLHRVDLSRVLSKWLGETERSLADVFDAAEEGHVMLLFDEADSLFAKRTEVKSSNDRYANLAVNFLLQRLDAFEGIAILTTNFGGSIDPAFMRRLSFRVTFPFPDDEMRARLWRAHLPPALPIDGTLDLDQVAASYSLSGGYIRNAALRAAFLAAGEGVAMNQAHLRRAVKLEYQDVGKLSTNGTLE